MDVREKEVEAIQSQALALSQEDANTAEVEGKFRAVEEKFLDLRGPLEERCHKLLASKEEHQFNRDLEDEIVSPRQCRWCCHLGRGWEMGPGDGRQE